MGTSASSNGPKGGVPFDPPWLDDIENPCPDNEIQPDSQGNSETDDDGQGINDPEHPPQPSLSPPQLAPIRRFQNARRNLGDFARTGNLDSFRKAIGHYSRTGLGGARNTANRMRSSTKSAANLFGVLQAAREGTVPAIEDWVKSLTDRNASAQDVVDEIIRLVSPDGGSQDETTCRESMAQAMEDLLEEDRNIDLLHLGDDGIWALIESFLGYEAFNRLCLDIGQVFESSTLSPRESVTRMNEMQDYLKAEIYAQTEQLRQTISNITPGQLQDVLQRALRNTFLVYEGYL